MPNHGSGKPKSSDCDKDEQNSKLMQIVSSKCNKIKNNLVSDTNFLTQLEVEKREEFEKEEFSSIVLKLVADEQDFLLWMWIGQNRNDFVESEETADDIYERDW